MFKTFKKYSIKKKIILFSLISLTGINLYAETFRIGKTHIFNLDLINSPESTVTLGINEGVAIYLPENNAQLSNGRIFIEGIEIKMDIPEEIASWMDCVACSVYDNVKPLPTVSQIDYSANRQYVSCLPGRLSWVLQIPVKKENNIKTNKYTTKIDTVPSFSNNVILIRLQPVMKGVPEETLHAKVPMTIKPVLSDKGLLKLNITNTDNSDSPNSSESNDNFSPSVYIDDKIVSFSNTDNSYLLETGVHTVSIISDSYRNEIRTVRVDQAKTTELFVTMKSTDPTIVINSPESAVIEFDDQPWDNKWTEIIITEGEHKIKFTIGDYEITRTIQAIQGKTYTVNFSIDLDISEE